MRFLTASSLESSPKERDKSWIYRNSAFPLRRGCAWQLSPPPQNHSFQGPSLWQERLCLTSTKCYFHLIKHCESSDSAFCFALREDFLPVWISVQEFVESLCLGGTLFLFHLDFPPVFVSAVCTMWWGAVENSLREEVGDKKGLEEN